MAILLILLDKNLFSVQQSTPVVLIFLLCLHSCIANNNENSNTNNNHSHLITGLNKNVNTNSYHLDSYSVKAIRDNLKGN